MSAQPWRPDAPSVGTFANFRDAIAEASFRAAITRIRYRVTYEPNNAWWQITEGSRFRPAPSGEAAEPTTPSAEDGA